MPVLMSGHPSPPRGKVTISSPMTDEKSKASTRPSSISAPVWPKGYEDYFFGDRSFYRETSDKTMSLTHGSSSEVDPYKKAVNGIVPGYTGHVPRGRDTFGVSAVGGLEPSPWANTRHMGAAVGHARTDKGQNELMSWELPHQEGEERFASFHSAHGGVMPGFAGHRPGARDVEAKTAFGQGSQTDARLGAGKVASWQLNDTADLGTTGGIETAAAADYRKRVNGLVPGYKGFVPGAAELCGGSPFGGVPTTAGTVEDLAQKGHVYAHKAAQATLSRKSGYSGHVPGARDTWGVSVLGEGLQRKPLIA